MTVPGSNLLNRAMTLLGQQSFDYCAFVSRVPNSIGLDVTTYAYPVTLTGSVQPLPRRLYEQYGLDLQRNYFNIFVSQNIIDVKRDVSGDQIIYNGKKLQCESVTDWFGADGWDSILCVQVP